MIVGYSSVPGHGFARIACPGCLVRPESGEAARCRLRRTLSEDVLLWAGRDAGTGSGGLDGLLERGCVVKVEGCRQQWVGQRRAARGRGAG